MIERNFYSILSAKAKREFCMSVYRFWQDKGYVTDSQMSYLEKGFNGVSKNKSYYRN